MNDRSDSYTVRHTLSTQLLLENKNKHLVQLEPKKPWFFPEGHLGDLIIDTGSWTCLIISPSFSLLPCKTKRGISTLSMSRWIKGSYEYRVPSTWKFQSIRALIVMNSSQVNPFCSCDTFCKGQAQCLLIRITEAHVWKNVKGYICFKAISHSLFLQCQVRACEISRVQSKLIIGHPSG